MIMGHRLRLAAVIAAASLFALASSAQADQTISVVNEAHVRPAILHRVEHAIGRQSWELAYWWHTQPIRFGPGGWKVYLVRRFTVDPVYGSRQTPDPQFGGAMLDGMHGIDLKLAYPRPYAVVQTRVGDGYPTWSATLSHEVLEMLVNPTTRRFSNGDLLEICDGVSPADYRIDGVWVADFTLPASWRTPLNWHLRFDEMGIL